MTRSIEPKTIAERASSRAGGSGLPRTPSANAADEAADRLRRDQRAVERAAAVEHVDGVRHEERDDDSLAEPRDRGEGEEHAGRLARVANHPHALDPVAPEASPDAQRLLDRALDELRPGVDGDRADQERRGQIAERVEQGNRAEPAEADGEPADRRPDQPRDLVVEGVQRVGLHELLLADQTRQQSALRRDDDERERRLDDGHEVDEPDRLLRAHEQQRQQRQREREVRDDEHLPAVPAVDDDAGDRAEHDARDHRRDEDAAGRERRVGQLVHGEREARHEHPVAGERDQPAEPEQAEAAVAEQREVLHARPSSR